MAWNGQIYNALEKMANKLDFLNYSKIYLRLVRYFGISIVALHFDRKILNLKTAVYYWNISAAEN